ncbi:2-oxoadipate dioxygenase/decarboxylase HglS [Vreelandella neptunia]|uniref:2-oxoadipate dioxygenase/decarboxylase n=1 Tax=Vreelandella neptunia TaxID=115551 RepID=A0ABS9S5L7_9GAMM|nr:VOC family protein [Halomonas neptunia]MCH4811410.1 VOC family protein [Halomonas neptunia]
MSDYFYSADRIRDRFSQAMSDMYQQEVPQYGTLLSLVAEVNQEVIERDTSLATALSSTGEMTRLHVERHGAIRVGSPAELSLLRRMFAVMGMFPVGYYDLSVAGVPVHATAFRPIDDEALTLNPFRLFTSLLRLELIANDELREQAAAIIASREIVTPQAVTLIERFEVQGGLNEAEAKAFVIEALETFRWHRDATVDLATYQALHHEHRLIADVVCFRGPHINHLTPRTLDIDEVQRRMPASGITPKAIIEGPPRRHCPILLRQTSFKALEESIYFADEAEGQHTARFGEIEQRGVALTRKGRTLYDQLLAASRQGEPSTSNANHQAHLAQAFVEFPDDQEVLRREGLAFFHYRVAPGAKADIGSTDNIEQLLAAGVLVAIPMIYEDFLPVSAAGIFQSNLGDGTQDEYSSQSSQQAFELALGAPVTDEIALYEHRQENSLKQALAELRGV